VDGAVAHSLDLSKHRNAKASTITSPSGLQTVPVVTIYLWNRTPGAECGFTSFSLPQVIMIIASGYASPSMRLVLLLTAAIVFVLLNFTVDTFNSLLRDRELIAAAVAEKTSTAFDSYMIRELTKVESSTQTPPRSATSVFSPFMDRPSTQFYSPYPESPQNPIPSAPPFNDAPIF